MSNQVIIEQAYDISPSIQAYIAKFQGEQYDFTVHLLHDAITLKDKFMLTCIGFEEDSIIDLLDSIEEVKELIQSKVLEINGVYSDNE